MSSSKHESMVLAFDTTNSPLLIRGQSRDINSTVKTIQLQDDKNSPSNNVEHNHNNITNTMTQNTTTGLSTTLMDRNNLRHDTHVSISAITSNSHDDSCMPFAATFDSP